MALGFIGAAFSAVGGNLKDQWKDAVICEDMTNNVLMMRKTTKTGVISHGSSIIVNPGQIAVIVSGGRVVDATAQEGVYRYEEGAPSFFAGDFGASFKDMWTRFTYGGGRPIQDSVFYINATEILDNGFGTATPVMYRDWEHAVMNARMGGLQPMKVDITCFGKYTFKIKDPAVFLREIAGTADIYEKETLCEQMRAEVQSALQAVLNELASEKNKISPLDLPSQTPLIKKIMQEGVYDEDIRRRGINIVSFAIQGIKLTEESAEKIDRYEIGGDAYQQQGVMTDAYATAMVDAANNTSGAATGFMGMGMVNMMGAPAMFGNQMMNNQMQQQNVQGMQNQGMNVAGTQQMMQQPQAAPTAQVAPAAAPATPTPAGMTCPKCGAAVAGKFCGECGTKIEVPTKKFCSNCGKEVSGKFCAECGTQVQ
ncbi:MAG: SPFH domain-containing protein [Lachnospiraceae bacterium]|nr:SPFH domain-containing protein [Lachnospiraceae bacterium]